VSVAELLAGVGSVTPPGTVTVAVLTRLPVADALTVPVRVYVTLPLTGRFTVALMLPEPLAVQLAPPALTHVQVGAVIVAGTVSATVAPVTALGPAFDATIVYVTGEPGTALATPSVSVIERSACGANVSVSVAELLAGVGSVTPPGTVTVAVLTRLPVAAALTVPVKVYVTLPPTGRFTVALMLPDPLAVQLAPPALTQVQVGLGIAAGTVSTTVAPVTALGPAFDATIVYVTGWPGTTLATPSVFVIESSAWGVNVSVSVAVLLAGVGSITPPGTVTVAVLTRLPVAEALTVPVRVYVTLPPTGRFTVALMLPDPLAVQVPPPAPTQVQVGPVIAAGTVSATVAPVTALGPGFDATIVYVIGNPGTAFAWPSVFVIERSA
jgi:hypothetical protein